jgi:DNA-binding MarR family transcriptional regulator
MAANDISLLADLIRAGALLEQFVRKEIASPKINDTQIWVLIVLTGLLEISRGEPKPEARSASWVASRLGFERERVAMSFRGLIKLHLIRPALRVKGQDGRTMNYFPTAEGRREATQLFKKLAALDRDVRSRGHIARNARAVDPQVIAYCLQTLLPTSDAPLRGFDKRRTSAVRKARSPTSEE